MAIFTGRKRRSKKIAGRKGPRAVITSRNYTDKVNYDKEKMIVELIRDYGLMGEIDKLDWDNNAADDMCDDVWAVVEPYLKGRDSTSLLIQRAIILDWLRDVDWDDVARFVAPR